MIWLSQIKWVVIQFWTLIWYLVLNSLELISSKHSAAAADVFLTLLLFRFLFFPKPNRILLFHRSFCVPRNLFVSMSDGQPLPSGEIMGKLTKCKRDGEHQSSVCLITEAAAAAPQFKKKNTFHFENWDFIKFPNIRLLLGC